MKTMLNDDRPIAAVWQGENPVARVGYNGVTRIVCYGEPSHYCDRPFVAVYEGDHLRSRHDVSGCDVFYATSQETNHD